jgi:hypothetical protein
MPEIRDYVPVDPPSSPARVWNDTLTLAIGARIDMRINRIEREPNGNPGGWAIYMESPAAPQPAATG